MVDEATSIKIRRLSLLAIVLVVAQHAWFVLGDAGEGALSRIIETGVYDWPVSFFYVVSGFFLFRRSGELGWYGRALRKRCKTLLIPYVAWILCALLVFAVFLKRGWSSFVWLDTFGITSKLSLLTPLWYVRNLFVLCLLSPLLLPICRLVCSLKVKRAAIAGVILAFYALSPIPAKRLIGMPLLYFVTGGIIALEYTGGASIFRVPKERICVWAITIYLLLLVMRSVNVSIPFCDIDWSRYLLVPLGILVSWFGYDLVISKNWTGRDVGIVRFCTSATFFCYCVHRLVMLLAEWVLNGRRGLGAYLLFVSGTVAVSFLIAYVLSKWMPRLYAILTGDRINGCSTKKSNCQCR